MPIFILIVAVALLFMWLSKRNGGGLRRRYGNSSSFAKIRKGVWGVQQKFQWRGANPVNNLKWQSRGLIYKEIINFPNPQ